MLLGIGSVLLSAVLLGIIPLLTKVLYAAGFDAISVAFYRHVCVLPILFLYCRIKKSSLRLPLRQLFQLSLYAGFFSAVTMLLLNLSYLYIPVGMATTLHFLYPAFVILICVVYYRQQIERPILCSLILVLFGIFCFFEQGSIQGMAGIALALLSAITYAVYLIQLERHRFNQMDSAVFTFYLSLCTIVMLMIVVAVNMIGRHVHMGAHHAVFELFLDVQVEGVAQIELGQIALEGFRIAARVEQRAHGHVSADAGKAVKIQDLHFSSSL